MHYVIFSESLGAAMDELLDERYRRLFETYDTDDWHTPSFLYYFERILPRRLLRREGAGLEPLRSVKERLSKEIAVGSMRADAALCLLALYDHMIFRPYAGYSPDGLPIHQIATDFGDFTQRVQHSLSIILTELRQSKRKVEYEEPRSSHDVLVAIDGVWGNLREFFNWA